MPKLTKLWWDDPSLREETVIVWEMLFHGHEIQSEEIFTRKDINAWKMVDFLMQMHPEESVGLNLSISPPNIPITDSFASLYHPSKLLSDFFNDRILCIRYIDDYLFGFDALSQLCNRDVLRAVVRIDLARRIWFIIVTVVGVILFILIYHCYYFYSLRVYNK